MTPEIELTLVKELAATRFALERIAAALETAVAAPVPAKQTGCTHPSDTRIDFGMTGGHEDWACGVPGCGYRSIEMREAVRVG